MIRRFIKWLFMRRGEYLFMREQIYRKERFDNKK